MSLSDILIPEVIAAALNKHWRGTSGYCFACGHPRAPLAWRWR